MIRPQMVSVTCPACRQNYATQVYPVVDVTEAPELKDLLLQGTLNAGICPHCGMQVELVSPFLYVDREKELALVLMPQELGLDHTRQQALIGDLTNKVLGALPPEERKAYLLQPRMFFTRKSLVEAILSADGVTPDMLKALQAKGSLLSELLSVADHAEKLEALVRQRDADVDEDLFAMATDILQQSAQVGQTAQAARAERVWEAIIRHSTWGQEALAEARKRQAETKAKAQAQLLEAILTAKDDEELEALLAVNRPLVDEDLYALFTRQAEEAKQADDGEKERRLRHLRGHVQDLTKELDRRTQREVEQALALLKTLMEAENMAAAVEEHADEVSLLLLQLVEFSIDRALREENREVAQRLILLRELVLEILEANAPPPVRLLGLLLEADDAEARKQIMEEHRDLVNYDFLLYVDAVLNDMETEGRWQEVKAVHQIRQEAAEFARG
ncbi:MAG: CpXC domain-containing protein [Anaerolineae bacterium]